LATKNYNHSALQVWPHESHKMIRLFLDSLF